MTGFMLCLTLLTVIGVTRVAFDHNADMFTSVGIAFLAAAFIGGVGEVSAGGNGVIAVEMIGLGLLMGPVLALAHDNNSSTKQENVLLSRETFAGMKMVAHQLPAASAARHAHAA